MQELHERSRFITVILEFVNHARGFPGEEVYGVLVAQPVGSFHGVVHVEEPVVIVRIIIFVIQDSVDATLSGYGVRSGREEFRHHRYAISFDTEAKSGPQSCASCSYHHYVVAVVYQGILQLVRMN